ncbi:MAG: helix-turn-helix domain-containing protein [Desulfamplus sp.]
MDIDNNNIDAGKSSNILTVKEAAQYLHKSTSWVYKNWKMLGGVKLGGSLIFPSKENLYDLIFGKGKGMEIRLHPERQQIDKELVQDPKGSKQGRSQKKRGDRKSESRDSSGSNPNRHGILEACE